MNSRIEWMLDECIFFYYVVGRPAGQCESLSVIITFMWSQQLCPHFLKYECSTLNAHLKADMFQQQKERESIWDRNPSVMKASLLKNCVASKRCSWRPQVSPSSVSQKPASSDPTFQVLCLQCLRLNATFLQPYCPRSCAFPIAHSSNTLLSHWYLLSLFCWLLFAFSHLRSTSLLLLAEFKNHSDSLNLSEFLWGILVQTK